MKNKTFSIAPVDKYIGSHLQLQVDSTMRKLQVLLKEIIKCNHFRFFVFCKKNMIQYLKSPSLTLDDFILENESALIVQYFHINEIVSSSLISPKEHFAIVVHRSTVEKFFFRLALQP